MKHFILITALMLVWGTRLSGQGCATCGRVSTAAQDGVSFQFSTGTVQYGQSAGFLKIQNALPDPLLFSPLGLSFSETDRTDVAVITTNVSYTNATITSEVDPQVVTTTNVFYTTNYVVDVATTNVLYTTNVVNYYNAILVTNSVTNATAITVPEILQVYNQAIVADVPPSPTTNGYEINFYYVSQIIGTNGNGTCQLSGQPFITWLITNANPAGEFQLQLSQIYNVPNYGLAKQWTYTYLTNSKSWQLQSLGGLVEQSVQTIGLTAASYETTTTLQASNGAMVSQTVTVYTNFANGASAPIWIGTGVSNAPEVTAYTYWPPGSFEPWASLTLVKSVIQPNGSWQVFTNYDTCSRPLWVYSSLDDLSPANCANARETVYTYLPSSAGVSGAGDNDTCYTNTPRLTVNYAQGQEISRQYTVFPSIGERLDIQAWPGAAWNSPSNLVTTNIFYTSGPNQTLLQAVFMPDGTASFYNYITNGLYQTNIQATGQPDPTLSFIVDGVSNVTVLNSAGYMVGAASYDVLSGLLLSMDTYTNFDSFGRPQAVMHLNGTIEYTDYACCGLDYTIDADGVITQYLYDAARRQTGYQKIYGSSVITYTNVLDAAGNILEFDRIGTDYSAIVTGQTGYDLAGELIDQTNALGGVTSYTRTNDPVTGGLIQTIVYANGGTCTNFYYADGSLKKTLGTAVHGIRYTNTVESDSGMYRLVNWAIKLDANGNDTSEWSKEYADAFGRNYKTVYSATSGTPTSYSYYNALGQLTNQVDPDGVSTIHEYNAKGELAYTVVDMNRNGVIDFGGSDHITGTINDVITDHGTTVRRAKTFVWGVNGVNSSNLVSVSESSADGLNSWQIQYRDAATPLTNHTQTAYLGNNRWMTNTAPDGSYSVSAYTYGQLLAMTHFDATGAQIGGVTYGYDAHERRNTMTDARNGTTTSGFNNADLVVSSTTPNPGGASPETTYTAYNNMEQQIGVTQPDGTTVSNVYQLTGEMGLQYGSRTYPVGYGYDYAGRMQTMTNWSSFGTSGAEVTTWKYDGYRGWLTNKVYDGAVNGPAYAYTAAGRLQGRTWARGTITSYAYGADGSLTNITYNDGTTPNVGYGFDRLGRKSAMVWSNITDTLSYNWANQLLGESFSGGILAGLAITNSYDQDLRRTNLTALSGSSPLEAAGYGYDNASRLQTVNDGNNNTATYSYLANSPLVSQIVFKQSGTTRMTMTKQYDYLNRLTQISSAPGAAYTLPLTYNYNYNAANQRTKDTLADGSYWVYGYDALGQVTNGCKFFADGTPVAGQQFDYAFDTIGNRLQTLTGGDTNGANLRLANYTNNSLNQITSRGVSGYVEVTGASLLTNAVTVNGNTAYRKGEYFWQELPVGNTGSPLWTNIIASGGQTVTGNVYVAHNPEILQYDADGNLTKDGRFTYTWDGENRLTGLIGLTTVPTAAKIEENFTYDPQGRRIQTILSTNTGLAYVLAATNKFLYDGWNLVAELKPDNTMLRRYMWGNDLSGTPQGAGGVGGLLEVSYNGLSTTNCFPAYDGDGDIMALINAADGTLAANYDYGPFGEAIRATGLMAKLNPIRFSTKYTDNESDLVDYVNRFYCASDGRWLSRDPVNELCFHLEETGRQIFCPIGGDSPPVGIEKTDIDLPNDFLIGPGGFNPYCFVSDNPICVTDVLGLDPWCICLAADPDHAWIIAFDYATGTTTTYGRWKLGYGHPAASSSGVLHNMEKRRTPVARRCVFVKTFVPTINAGYDNRNNNCATYADSEWKRVSGESLDDRSHILGVGFDYPPVLIDSIKKANGGTAIGPRCCPLGP